MTDRPVLFSAQMVLALLAGRKTQTRRLATSPLRRVEIGDRLWVREQLWIVGDGVRYAAAEADAYCFDVVDNHVFHPGRDLWLKYAKPDGAAVGRPSIFMPRWASRLTLTVTDKRFQSLKAIIGADAIAEGIERIDDPRGACWKSYETLPDGTPHPHAAAPNRSPVTSYAELWESLHRAPGERWDDSPEVVALTFTVEQRNIDA